MDEIKSILSNKKVLINLVILAALAAILPFVIQLVRESQILKSRASNPGIQVVGPSPNVDVKNVNGSPQTNLRPTLNNSGDPVYSVELQLTAPAPTTAP